MLPPFSNWLLWKRNLLFCKGSFPTGRLKGWNCYFGDWGITYIPQAHTHTHRPPHPEFLWRKVVSSKVRIRATEVILPRNVRPWLTPLGWFNIQAWHEVCWSYFKVLRPALGYRKILTPCQVDLTPWGRGRSADSHTFPIGCLGAIIYIKKCLYWQRKMNNSYWRNTQVIVPLLLCDSSGSSCRFSISY